MSLKLKVFSLPSAVRSALLGLVGYLTACGSNPMLLATARWTPVRAWNEMESLRRLPTLRIAADDGVGPSAPDARTVDDPVDGGADAVIGTVLDFETHRALPRRIVTIDAVSALTDDAGRFSIPHAPAVYDALIVDPGHSTVSLYRSLERRKPTMLHHPSVAANATDHACRRPPVGT